MHDIWNPWHGCIKYSEGCDNCYMYYLDKKHNESIDSSICKKTSNFNYPLQRDKNGIYKVKDGETLRVCMTSDFFFSGADEFRDEAWEMMRLRPLLKFYVLTKRAERIKDHLPKNIGDEFGQWDTENMLFNVTCENQERADERIPILLELPFKHKGLMLAPILSPIDIEPYLKTNKIEMVICGGENYGGSRPCHYEWIVSLKEQCKKYGVTFNFTETGNTFVKDGKIYNLKGKTLQASQAYKSGLSFKGKDVDFKLHDEFFTPFENHYVPHFREKCIECAARLTCNGCGDCNKCGKSIVSNEIIEEYDRNHKPWE